MDYHTLLIGRLDYGELFSLNSVQNQVEISLEICYDFMEKVGRFEMEKEVLLDTYVLQQDMRIRLPKQILNNLNVVKGETMFNVYMNTKTGEIILRVAELGKGDNGDAK